MKHHLIPIIISAALTVTACNNNSTSKENDKVATPETTTVKENTPANLNDLEIAHVAYTADNIDIRYATIALARSTNPEIHAFAETMIRDHTAVNELALALLDKLGAQAQDNFLSKKLNADADIIAAKLESLSGAEFDIFYASNELSYHKTVNDLIENTFIPNIENSEVKELFEAGLGIFTSHQDHAQMMVDKLEQ